MIVTKRYLSCFVALLVLLSSALSFMMPSNSPRRVDSRLRHQQHRMISLLRLSLKVRKQ